MKKVVVIGAGPAGIFAALASKNENTQVIILERNDKLGKKLAITGKGRCNITNSKDISEFFQEFNRNANFCYSSLYTYTNESLMNFFIDRGLDLKFERGGRVFPVSDNSFHVIDVLRRELEKKQIDIRYRSLVENIKKTDEFEISTNNGVLRADSLIIASGGVSYPTTGSDGKGYVLAKKLNHNITNIMPALVPIDLKDKWVKDLAGVTLKNIELRVKDDKKVVAKEFGELLFTHTGISGPIVLKASSQMDNKSKYNLSLNLKPALDRKDLDLRIQKDFEKYKNKALKNSLDDLTIKALIPIIIGKSGVDGDKLVHQITKIERLNIVDAFINFKLEYKSLKDAKYGIVTRGGIDVASVNPSTMESKLVDNLYFAGEILDVDANTGGFNLQFAFSSGYLAGKNCGGKV